MKSKLTLSIEKSVLEEARTLLKEEGLNLSRTFENHLKKLVAQKKKEKHYALKESELLPEVREVLGIFKTPNQDERPYKEILQEELLKKYGRNR